MRRGNSPPVGDPGGPRPIVSSVGSRRFEPPSGLAAQASMVKRLTVNMSRQLGEHAFPRRPDDAGLSCMSSRERTILLTGARPDALVAQADAEDRQPVYGEMAGWPRLDAGLAGEQGRANHESTRSWPRCPRAIWSLWKTGPGAELAEVLHDRVGERVGACLFQQAPCGPFQAPRQFRCARSTARALASVSRHSSSGHRVGDHAGGGLHVRSRPS